ncbi:hypothetical protein T439DRAFT_378313 [Meredithblackwellia eburnea MCA 4105]
MYPGTNSGRQQINLNAAAQGRQGGIGGSRPGASYFRQVTIAPGPPAPAPAPVPLPPLPPNAPAPAAPGPPRGLNVSTAAPLRGTAVSTSRPRSRSRSRSRSPSRSISLSPRSRSSRFSPASRSPSVSPERGAGLNQFIETADSFLGQPNPNDLQIIFPRTSSEIWANSKLLAKVSPYFKDLIESGFSETVEQQVNDAVEPTTPDGDTKGKRRARSVSVEALPFEDSDDEWETDHPPTLPVENPGVTPRYKITITEAAHSTYHAVLVWIYTGQIRFRRLLSLKGVHFESTSTSPLLHPVSPKSVYRLADFLSLPTLKQLALRQFERNLTPGNAAKELYSPLCRTFLEMQEVALKYTEKNWDRVRASEGMKKIDDLLEADGEEAGSLGLTSHRLAKRLRGRDSW